MPPERPPTTASVSGMVQDSAGPVSGAGIHVIYELDTISTQNAGAAFARPEVVIPAAAVQINTDSIACEYELLAELVGLSDCIRISLNTRREFGLDSFEVFRDTARVVRWKARNGSGGHMYFAEDRSVQSYVDYSYVLAAQCKDGLRDYSSSISARTNPNLSEIPGYVLHQNYPNPATDSTTVSYFLNASGWMDLALYNAGGHFVRNIWSSTQSYRLIGPNVHRLSVSRLCNGLYEYRMAVADVFHDSRKLLKNQQDYAVLRTTPAAATTNAAGHFDMAVSVGDTIALYGSDDVSAGTAILRRIRIAALADGYLPADTTLEMIPGEGYEVELRVEREP
jgi:hypothetical protein